MLPIEHAPLVDHLRFDPETELQPHPIDAVDQLLQCAAQLFLIRDPVSEGLIIIIACTEPAIVHDQHLDPLFFCLLGKLDKQIAGKIKVGRLPAVDEDRTHLVAVLSPAYMLSDARMILMREDRQSAVCKAQDDFRRRKGFSRTQRIAEFIFHKTDLYAGTVVLVLPGFRLEASAVREHHSIDGSVILRRVFVSEDDERIELVRGHSSPASDHLIHMQDGGALENALHRMSSVKGNQIIPARDKVKGRAERLFNIYFSVAAVPDDHRAGNNFTGWKYTVEKRHFHLRDRILRNDLQRLRLCLVRIYCGQPFQSILSLPDLMALIAQIDSARSVRILNDERGTPVIPGSRRRKLLRKGIQRIRAVLPRFIRASGKSPVRIGEQIFHGAFRAVSVIQMEQMSVRSYQDLICRIVRVKSKCLFFFAKNNRHGVSFHGRSLSPLR